MAGGGPDDMVDGNDEDQDRAYFQFQICLNDIQWNKSETCSNAKHVESCKYLPQNIFNGFKFVKQFMDQRIFDLVAFVCYSCGSHIEATGDNEIFRNYKCFFDLLQHTHNRANNSEETK